LIILAIIKVTTMPKRKNNFIETSAKPDNWIHRENKHWTALIGTEIIKVSFRLLAVLHPQGKKKSLVTGSSWRNIICFGR